MHSIVVSCPNLRHLQPLQSFFHNNKHSLQTTSTSLIDKGFTISYQEVFALCISPLVPLSPYAIHTPNIFTLSTLPAQPPISVAHLSPNVALVYSGQASPTPPIHNRYASCWRLLFGDVSRCEKVRVWTEPRRAAFGARLCHVKLCTVDSFITLLERIRGSILGRFCK